MTYGLITIAALALALGACAGDSAPMWKGTDMKAPMAGLPPPPAYPVPVWAQSPQNPPQPQRRVGSGASPDLLRGPAETVRPPTPTPLTSSPSSPSFPSPSAPASPLDGPGFLRTGPIANGPGGTYNAVGSTIFGPGGKVCTPVGSSLTCL